MIERASSNQPWVAPLVRRGDGFKPNTADTHEAAVAYLASCYPSLTFVTWWLNGAGTPHRLTSNTRLPEPNPTATLSPYSILTPLQTMW